MQIKTATGYKNLVPMFRGYGCYDHQHLAREASNNDGRYRTPFVEFEGVRMSVEMKSDILKVREKIIESVR